ncbi:MAG: NAD(P)/FAD-dependent oxidoreductase [Acidobacteria bacterium]|nr:NAD(P)/FAD-dependent oxidoreductase [Acidobacteriota bacterium]
MSHYQYLIIGGGMTADAAVGGIREIDPKGSIGLISQEPYRLYNRPPLSKALWKGEPLDSIWRQTETRNVEMLLGRKAVRFDPKQRSVEDDLGVAHTYERLLLATGGKPRRFPFGGDHIIYFRTLDDYQRLRKMIQEGARRFAVIGGGFIGSEIAAALAMNKMEVVMIFPEAGIGARLFPPDLAEFLNKVYRDKGVELLVGETITGLQAGDSQLVLKAQNLKTQQEREIVVNGIVAGLGIEPNVDLAVAAGLRVDNGIVVNEFLCTSDSNIYAAGDVANFHSPALGKRLRVEHEDNANTMGRAAGRAMAGDSTPYHHLSLFYSDLFELGYEAVGELDSRLQPVSDWKEPYREGVVYYLEAGSVRGVLLWNVWGKVDAARDLIAKSGPFHPDDLKGRIAA